MHDDLPYSEPIAKRVFDYAYTYAKRIVKYFKPDYPHRTFADGLHKAADMARQVADVHTVLKPQISPTTALQMLALKYDALAKQSQQSFVSRHLKLVLISLFILVFLLILEAYTINFLKPYTYDKVATPISAH